ncbi:hypothetical protein FACS189426_18740 [Bacteroidia bacterium]|nr:hypothetical protein FACS189426_18740 [Bacteroidia bacterium]
MKLKNISRGLNIQSLIHTLQKKIISLFLFVLLFLFACNGKNKEINAIVDYFDKEQSLAHKALDIHDDLNVLIEPQEIVIHNNLMVVAHVRDDKLFSLVNLNEKKVIKSWGDRGQGPYDFVGFLDMYENYDNSGINIWDPSLKRLNFFSFDRISNQENPLPQNLFHDLNNPNMLTMLYPNILQLDKSRYLALGNSEDKRFTLLNIESDVMIKTGDFPSSDHNKDLHPIIRNQPYNGKIRFNKRQQKIAYISYESEMFEIFQVADSGLTLVYGNYTTIPKYELSTKKGGTVTERIGNGNGRCIALTTSDEKIFILYQDYPKNADKKDIDLALSQEANIILEFDWNGKPIRQYHLDCMVNLVFYDKDGNKLYASQSPENKIVYFDIK